MRAPDSFDYALIRVVPRIERGECVNVGVILFCRTRNFLGTRVELDVERVLALDPAVDLDEVRQQLDHLLQVSVGDPVGGPIAALSRSERFHWLTAPRSTVIQISPVHSGLSPDPQATLDHLVETMVRVRSADRRM
jgi:hypothetical protein